MCLWFAIYFTFAWVDLWYHEWIKSLLFYFCVIYTILLTLGWILSFISIGFQIAVLVLNLWTGTNLPTYGTYLSFYLGFTVFILSTNCLCWRMRDLFALLLCMKVWKKQKDFHFPAIYHVIHLNSNCTSVYDCFLASTFDCLCLCITESGTSFISSS